MICAYEYLQIHHYIHKSQIVGYIHQQLWDLQDKRPMF